MFGQPACGTRRTVTVTKGPQRGRIPQTAPSKASPADPAAVNEA